MEKPDEDVRLTLRLSPALYNQIAQLANGGGLRPPAPINPTIIWLLERALDASAANDVRKANAHGV